MAKDKGGGRNGRRSSMAALEDTDPMTKEELLEAFGHSGPEPTMGTRGADDGQRQPEPAEQRIARH
jgi:hypothetical protein